jgi:hypothetical protein
MGREKARSFLTRFSETHRSPAMVLMGFGKSAQGRARILPLPILRLRPASRAARRLHFQNPWAIWNNVYHDFKVPFPVESILFQ